jgi:tryptophan 7-halogenase
MADQIIRSIAIIGGGTAGWLAAATLSRVLRGQAAITVVDTGPAGDLLAEATATLPALRVLHEILGIDEADLIRRAGGTFRLGTRFDGWNAAGQPYFHPFGEIGANLNGTPFRNHWLKLRAAGDVPAFADFSVAANAAKAGKFARPAADKRSVLSTLDHGYHLDTASYTDYLRAIAEKNGVTRATGIGQGITRNSDTGLVEALSLANGTRLPAEFFVDCSGQLMDALDVGTEDWSGSLPCDRIVSIDTDALPELPPFTRATAHEAGWQWCIPLRGRTGNGYVYAGAFQSEVEAEAKLLANLSGPRIGEVRHASFRSGRRREFRHKNVVALGRAACTLEPLEGAPLHIIHIGINRLLALFPDRTHSAVEAAEYNRIVGNEMDRLRDFLVAHYKTTGRGDTAFWRRCAELEISPLLERKLVQFKSRGRVVLYDEEPFQEPSWSALLIGQGMVPDRVDPYIDGFDTEMLRGQAQRIHSVVRQGADSMPPHKTFLDKLVGTR